MSPPDPFSSFPYVHWRTIPFGDTDAAAIVYTPRFVDYCMEAVELWLKHYIGVDWYRINVQQQRGTPVVHLELDFKGAVIAGDDLGVIVRVAKVGRASLSVDLEGIKAAPGEGAHAAIFGASFTFCFTRTDLNKAISIPEEERLRLQRYQEKCGYGSQ